MKISSAKDRESSWQYFFKHEVISGVFTKPIAIGILNEVEFEIG